MQDKQREQRRHKRAEKRKKERANASRPGLGGPTNAMDPLKGRSWPVGECYVSVNADEPGATIEVVISRSRAEGSTVVAAFEIDRSGPGLLSARAIGGLRREHVAAECARLSEKSGRSMVACSGALAASLVRDARRHGTNPEPAGAKVALALLEGIPEVELPTAFGPGESAKEAAGEGASGSEAKGFWAGLRKRILG